MNWKIKSLPILAMLLFIGCSNPEPKRSTASEYASVESLAEVEDVIIARSNWKLIDLRKPEEFEQGHIPKAKSVWRTDITDTTYPYGGMMPTQFHMERLLSKLGVQPSDTIVIYDEKAACDAARLWWILKFYGHQHVRLLNGGLAAWKASGKELIANTRPSDKTEYVFKSEHDSSLLVMFQSVQSIDDTALVLLDTRGEEEYSGKFHKNGAAYPGHINGAISLDWANTVDFHGTQKFRSAEELTELFSAIGIDETRPVITYCHSGVRSAHTLFVLNELLGYRNIRNYDGSWIEWSHLNDSLLR